MRLQHHLGLQHHLRLTHSLLLQHFCNAHCYCNTTAAPPVTARVPKLVGRGDAEATKPATVHYNVTAAPVPFGFAVSRADAPAGAAPLFDTRGHRLVFKEQYMEVTTSLPKNSSVYGYSERTPSQGFRLQRDGIPMASWTRDSAAADPDLNSYGSWPFYMEIREGAAQSSGSGL